MNDNNFQLLPEELLLHILRKLEARDLLAFALTCKTYYEFCVSLNGLWSRVIQREYSIVREAGSVVIPESRLYYVKVLKKFGYLRGLWKAKSLSDYGGLYFVRVEESRIVGFELRAPRSPHLMLPLRRIPVFEIALNDRNSEPLFHCLLGREKHRLKVEANLHGLCTDNFSRECQDRGKHKAVDEYTQDDLVGWLNEEVDMSTEGGMLAHRMFILKFLSIKQYEYKGTYERLYLSEPPCEVRIPLKPGLFKGTYSAHGLEVIKLYYHTEGNEVEAVKLTGDPNIPAGKVTIRAHLPYAMHLTKEDQGTFDSLEAIPSAMSAIRWEEMPGVQPFVIPRDCSERFLEPVPNYCIARFHGFGQIAHTGFQNPSFTPGHWIIFSEDLFGFIWLELRTLSLYHRVLDEELM